MTAVSIIVPAYNAEAFIAEALASATAQTLPDIEIVVIDDASTDATARMVEEVAATDPRIRLIRQDSNAGPSAARNRGITVAAGRWIAILDADDAYEPDRLARLVELGERREADLVSDNLLLVTDDGRDRGRSMIPASILAEPRPLLLAEFIRRNVEDPLHPACNYGFLKPLFRADFLRDNGLRYDERVRFAEDFSLYAACFRAGARWWLAPQPTYRYRVRADSLTQVQTVHDLGRLREQQHLLLAAADGDHNLTGLIRRHMTVVDRCYYYRSFTDDLKSGRVRSALATLGSSGRAAGLIAQEVARQAPVVVRKLFRGGYRGGANRA